MCNKCNLFSFTIPYYLGYKAMVLYPIQGLPWLYIGYKAMALYPIAFFTFLSFKIILISRPKCNMNKLCRSWDIYEDT